MVIKRLDLVPLSTGQFESKKTEEA
jgi:hypothetical protein